MILKVFKKDLMTKTCLLFILFLCFDLFARGMQKEDSLQFIPDRRIFPVIFLDPIECQINGGSYFLNQKEQDLSLYSVVNLGFNRPVLAKHARKFSWEINFGAANFSQFELREKSDGTYLAGLLNSDFKLSGDLSIKKNKNNIRLRIFHVSSHLGDDYLARNQDTLQNDKSVNYEQADLTYLRSAGSNFYYCGIGVIFTKYVYRERLSFQGGGLYNFKSSGPNNLFTSLNINVLAENDFVPDVRTAFGLSFNRRSDPLFRIWLEYYNGQLPYSTLDYGRVNWLGLALWMKLI